jgi:K+-transporting ATPase KdpF subunit
MNLPCIASAAMAACLPVYLLAALLKAEDL